TNGVREDMMQLITRFLKDRDGATAIEYGMIAALIAVVIIGTLQIIGTQLNAKFNSISAQLN
ncbi:Flp family type IVb pilin, partial [Klebsiella variicola]